MRQLTDKQKKVLEGWYGLITEGASDTQIDKFLIKGKRKNYVDINDLPVEIWDQLEEINDTEILWQEVNRWIADKILEEMYQV